MKASRWNEVPDAIEYEKLTPGGYICRICGVEDNPEKEYLKIEYDIDQGPNKNYYTGLYQSKGFWAGRLYKSYKQKALPLFKRFLTAVSESNPGFVFDNDEKKLIGKQIGLVLSEEEYRKNDGAIGKRLTVSAVKSIEHIQKGAFTIAPCKTLEAERGNDFHYTNGGFLSAVGEADESDLPF